MQELNKPLKHLRVLVLATTYPRWENDSTPHFVFDLNRQLAKKVETWALVPHFDGAKYSEEMDYVRIIRFPYFFPERYPDDTTNILNFLFFLNLFIMG